MRKWSTLTGIQVLERFVSELRESKLVEPGGVLLGDPIDLKGLTFPTVTQCEEFNLPAMVVKSISGNQEFDDATLRRIDLSKARLDFSVWNNCCFYNVCFDSAKLLNVRFFGCAFHDCSFRSANLRDASFSVGRNGAETKLVNTRFERADFRGASCCNPVLKRTRFANCKFGQFVFESAECDDVTFTGEYKELTFRGTPGNPSRNCLDIDLSNANICWLNANHGLDLACVKLPSDGSDRSISPLSHDQKTFLISRRMIEYFADKPGRELATEMFGKLRLIAEQEGLLPTPGTTSTLGSQSETQAGSVIA
jgi:uncharacterized protein YjbI with pentapeptide repeats